MDGTREGGDFARADKAAGISAEYRKEQGLTWHHHHDGQTMELVPQNLNNPEFGGVPHSGGASIIGAARSVATSRLQNFSVGVAAFFAPNTTEAYMKEEMALSDGVALDLRDATPPAWLLEVGNTVSGVGWLKNSANRLNDLGSDINARGTYPAGGAPAATKSLIDSQNMLKDLLQGKDLK